MLPCWALHWGNSISRCRAEERGLSEEEWEKEFEFLTVQSCVLVEGWQKHSCDDQGWLQGQGGRGSVEQGGDTRQPSATSGVTRSAVGSKLPHFPVSSDFSSCLY